MGDSEVSNEEKEITAEYALADTIDGVFKYLKIKDLCTAARVCKLWQEAAARGLLKRGPEIQLLPAYNAKVNDVLNVKPYVAFLFVGPSKRERYANELEIDILNRYKKFFPHHLVAVGVDESMMDDKQIVSCDGLLGPANGILGLFLPQYRNLQIKVKCEHHHSESTDRIVEYLAPNDKTAKTTLILFARPYGYDGTILEQIKRTFKQKSYTLWGGSFDDHLLAIDRTTGEDYTSADNHSSDEEFYDSDGIYYDGYYPDRSPYRTTALFAMSISGPNLESWSTIISCLIPKSQFDEKLQSFRQNFHLKRHTIGLACGPRYVEASGVANNDHEKMYMDSHELMEALKRCLPDIHFIGIFNFGYHSHFGVDSTSDDANQRLGQQMAISLMVLTYD